MKQMKKKRNFFRKLNEENKELRQNERFQNREKLVEQDNNLGGVFELATTKKTCVIRMILHEIKIENLLRYTSDFELIGSMFIGWKEHENKHYI